MSKIVPSGTGFVDEAGKRFVPIGHCEWSHLLLKDQTSYVKRCRDFGESVLRVLLEPLPLETFSEDYGIGNYDKLDMFLDPIANACSVYGLRLDIGAYSPWLGGMNKHPYFVHGLIKSFDEYFGEPAKNALMARLSHIATRYQDVLFGIEFAGEVQLDKRDWIESMLLFCKELGVMGSVSCMSEAGNSLWAQWSSPNLSYVSFHTYGNDRLFIESLPFLVQGTAVLPRRLDNVSKVIKEVRAKCIPGKPIMDSETPRLPLSAWSRFLTRWSLLSIPQATLERNFYDVAYKYMELGAASPGYQWSSSLDGAQIDGKPSGLSLGMFTYQANIRDTWGL